MIVLLWSDSFTHQIVCMWLLGRWSYSEHYGHKNEKTPKMSTVQETGTWTDGCRIMQESTWRSAQASRQHPRRSPPGREGSHLLCSLLVSQPPRSSDGTCLSAVLSMSHSTTESGAFKKPRDRDQTLGALPAPAAYKRQAPGCSSWFPKAGDSTKPDFTHGWGLREGSAHWFWGGMQRRVMSSGEWGALPEARPCLSEQETMPRRGGA